MGASSHCNVAQMVIQLADIRWRYRKLRGIGEKDAAQEHSVKREEFGMPTGHPNDDVLAAGGV